MRPQPHCRPQPSHIRNVTQSRLIEVEQLIVFYNAIHYRTGSQVAIGSLLRSFTTFSDIRPGYPLTAIMSSAKHPHHNPQHLEDITKYRSAQNYQNQTLAPRHGISISQSSLAHHSDNAFVRLLQRHDR